MRAAFCLLVFSGVVVSNAHAQQVRDYGTTNRGRISDGASLIAARDAVAQAGLDCDVTSALFRGRDESRASHYEVSCRNALGYLIVAGTPVTAHDCLLLASQNQRARRGEGSARFTPTCRLPANRNPARRLGVMAAEAGFVCDSDEGASLGRSASGNALYEIGCRGMAGAWLEKMPNGWLVTDCVSIRAQRGTCQFTTEVEELATFSDWMNAGAAQDCEPTQLYAMGRNAIGLIHYQVECRSGPSRVVVLDADRTVVRVLSCEDARHIGNGCSQAPVSAPHSSARDRTPASRLASDD